MAKEAKQQQGGAVVNRDEELKRQIEAQQRLLGKMRTGGKFISFKGGNIIVDKKAIPGAKTNVILLAFMGERTYFEQDFDPDEAQSPNCYAYYDMGEEELDTDGLKPHAEAAEPQAKLCEDCQWNEWGSAKKGRGKRCRESIRVALMPADKNMAKAEVWHARIPITSVPAFNEHVSGILGFGKSLHSVVSELSVIPDERTSFKILWDVKGDAPRALKAMLDNKALTAQRSIDFTYPKFEEEKPKKPAKEVKGQAKRR